MYTLICYHACSTCKGIEKQMKSQGLVYYYREITEDIPSGQELMDWYQRSGETSLKKMMNTSGTKYREGHLKDRLQGKSDQEQLDILSEDGMLIKRPILLTPEGQVFIGKAVQHYLDHLAIDEKR